MKSPLRAALASLLLVASATACNSDALPPASGFTSVAGTILDAASNKPVSGAVITIDTLLTATTDANGKFSIDKVPSGIVDYTVQATGYAPVSSTTSVEPGKPFELDLTLAAPP